MKIDSPADINFLKGGKKVKQIIAMGGGGFSMEPDNPVARLLHTEPVTKNETENMLFANSQW